MSKRVVRLDFCTCEHVNVQVARPFTVHAVLNMYMFMFSTSHSKAVMSHNASACPCRQCACLIGTCTCKKNQLRNLTEGWVNLIKVRGNLTVTYCQDTVVQSAWLQVAAQ